MHCIQNYISQYPSHRQLQKLSDGTIINACTNQSPAETHATYSLHVGLSHKEAAHFWMCPPWRVHHRVSSLRSELSVFLITITITNSLLETLQIINLLDMNIQPICLSTQLLLLPSVLAMPQPAYSGQRHHSSRDSRGERWSSHSGPQPSDKSWYLQRSQPGTPPGSAIPLARKEQPASTSISQLREPAAQRIKYSATTKLTNRQ